MLVSATPLMASKEAVNGMVLAKPSIFQMSCSMVRL
jgi:hypothetical protein